MQRIINYTKISSAFDLKKSDLLYLMYRIAMPKKSFTKSGFCSHCSLVNIF